MKTVVNNPLSFSSSLTELLKLTLPPPAATGEIESNYSNKYLLK